MNHEDQGKFFAAMEEFSEVKEELEYLRFFYSEADFGPADEDVRSIINDRYTKRTGKELPKGYGDEE